MFDDRLRLLEEPSLFDLLTHYVELAHDDRDAWLDRRARHEGVGSGDLTRLHGELLAYGWLEQNTGQTPELRPGLERGAAPRCYRVTTAGLRAVQDVVEGVVESVSG